MNGKRPGSGGSKYVLKRRSRWKSGRRRRRRRESRGWEDEKEVGKEEEDEEEKEVVGDRDEKKDLGRGRYRT